MNAEWWEFQTEAVRHQVYEDLRNVHVGGEIELRAANGDTVTATIGKRIPYEPGCVLPYIDIDPQLIERLNSAPGDREVS